MTKNGSKNRANVLIIIIKISFLLLLYSYFQEMRSECVFLILRIDFNEISSIKLTAFFIFLESFKFLSYKTL
ncbi:hypothetical protein F3W77_21235 [Vibrio parahaemolyticus]|nr:hypothetical protein [Vibrio parahaemolyticus]